MFVPMRRLSVLFALIAVLLGSIGATGASAATGSNTPSCSSMRLENPTLVSSNHDPASGPVVMFLCGNETVAVCTSTPSILLLVQSNETTGQSDRYEISVPQLCGGLWENSAEQANGPFAFLNPRYATVVVLGPNGSQLVERCTNQDVLFVAKYDRETTHIIWGLEPRVSSSTCGIDPATASVPQLSAQGA